MDPFEGLLGEDDVDLLDLDLFNDPDIPQHSFPSSTGASPRQTIAGNPHRATPQPSRSMMASASPTPASDRTRTSISVDPSQMDYPTKRRRLNPQSSPLHESFTGEDTPPGTSAHTYWQQPRGSEPAVSTTTMTSSRIPGSSRGFSSSSSSSSPSSSSPSTRQPSADPGPQEAPSSAFSSSSPSLSLLSLPFEVPPSFTIPGPAGKLLSKLRRRASPHHGERSGSGARRRAASGTASHHRPRGAPWDQDNRPQDGISSAAAAAAGRIPFSPSRPGSGVGMSPSQSQLSQDSDFESPAWRVMLQKLNIPEQLDGRNKDNYHKHWFGHNLRWILRGGSVCLGCFALVIPQISVSLPEPSWCSAFRPLLSSHVFLL